MALRLQREIPAERKEIEGIVFHITPLLATPASSLFVALVGIISAGGSGATFSEETIVAAMVRPEFEAFFQRACTEFKASTRVEIEGDNGEVNTPSLATGDIFEHVFRQRMRVQGKWLVACFALNYADFFGSKSSALNG